MSRIADLQHQLLDTGAAIEQAERILSRGQASRAHQLNLESLQKRFHKLEREFQREAAARGLDICSYRVIPERSWPAVAKLSRTLMAFQTLFSVTYDSFSAGPKRRARLSEEVLSQTTLGFGYAFSGSVGLVLTLPGERPLLEPTALDNAIEAISDVANAASSEQVAFFARKLGPAVVRAVFEWASGNVDAEYSAEIDWLRDEMPYRNLRIQLPRFRELQQVIAETSDETIEQVTVSGLLVGADVPRRTFRLQVEGGEIRGRFSDAISAEHTVELPKPYVAVLRKHTVIQYATDEERVEYFLIALQTG